MKTLVAYYSRTGNNRYLASRVAQEYKADVLELKPNLQAFPVMVIFSLLGWPLGLKRFSVDPWSYDRLIVCGPLWMGRLCLPCFDFLRAARKRQKVVHLITCCGSTDEKKDDSFGYGKIFGELRTKLGATLGQTQAFPINLVVPEDQRANPEAIMAARLNDLSFVGPMAQRVKFLA
jgi:hypothetical protein